MQPVPGIDPFFSGIQLLENFLSKDIVVPEVRLMRLRLEFIDLGNLLVEVKDTPSATRVASFLLQVFLSGLRTCQSCIESSISISMRNKAAPSVFPCASFFSDFVPPPPRA
jgi:hypothetical protein